MSDATPTESGFTSPRDKHLFGGGHKRILSLDGGGVRGAMTIAFLERLEKLVEEVEGKPTLLGDWFDLIGGTSTGAIIATGLALGFRASQLREFYWKFGPRVFQRSMWRLTGLRARFDSRQLVRELTDILGQRTMGSEDLRTGLCIVTKRIDTGSTWIVMNNPRSRFWDTPADKSFIGNRYYPLVNVVRASTAAPNYFDPEPIEIVKGAKAGLFVDGGVSPHNTPALHLLMVAALPPYGLCWPLGADNLTVFSVGTGTFRPRVSSDELPWLRTLGIAVHALTAQVSDAQQLVLMLMSWMGDSKVKWIVSSELGDLGDAPPPYGMPLFNFLRYDVRLELDWIRQELGRAIDKAQLSDYRRLDAPENIPAIHELGELAAERQVLREHVERAYAKADARSRTASSPSDAQ
jgi:hypothetical protein